MTAGTGRPDTRPNTSDSTPGTAETPLRETAANPADHTGTGAGTGESASEGTGGSTPAPDQRPDGTQSGAGSGLFGRSLLFTIVSAAQLATGALVSPVLAHVLDDPAQVGLLSAAISLHQLLAVLVLVGIDQAVVLQRAQDGHDHSVRALAGAALLLIVGVTLLVWGTAVWWAPLFGFPAGSVALPGLVGVTVWWTVPSAVVMVLLALLLAGDRLRAYSVVSLLAAVGGQVLGLSAVLALGGGATTYAWGLLGADLIAAVVAWRLTRPRWRGVVSPRVLGPALVFGAPIMISMLASYVLNAGDRVVLQRLAGSAELGRYQIAYTVGFLAVQLIVLAGNAWLPRFASIADQEARRRLVGGTRDQVYGLLTPVMLGMALAAPVALEVAAPASFDPRNLLGVVVLVALSAYPVAAATASGRMLVTERRTRPLAVCTAVAAALNVALNLVLVPVMGIAGAAAATLVAYVVQALTQRWALRSQPGSWPTTAPRTLVEAGLVSVLTLALVVVPATGVLDSTRFVVAAVVCLPWCLRRLQRAKATMGAAA